MKVAGFDTDQGVRRGQMAALERFLALGPDGLARPCPGCRERGPGCGPDCAEAPRALSSDPEHFPIEAGIIPLVFALRKSALGRPCWSCEGHIGTDGGLWKRPGVWFYAAHQVAADLIAQHIWQLVFARRLKLSWRVGLIATDNALDTTFTIEPDCHADASLDDLHRDVETIAAALPQATQALARRRFEALTSGDKS